MGKRLKIGILGALMAHMLFLFYVPAWLKPNHFDVIVAPSSLEVSLVTPMTPIIQKNFVVKPDPEHIETNKEKVIEKKTEDKEIQENIQKQPAIIQKGPTVTEKKEIKNIVRPPRENFSQDIPKNVVSGALIEAIPNQDYNIPPQYPRLARERGYEGRVLVAVYISKDGHVKDIKVLHSSGYKILDNTTLKSIRRWQFQPARQFGMPVESMLKIPFVFKLNNA